MDNIIEQLIEELEQKAFELEYEAYSKYATCTHTYEEMEENFFKPVREIKEKIIALKDKW